MDPLSVSASIIALLQASATVVRYIKSSKDANKDIKALLVEVINVRGLLFSLQDLLPDPDSNEDAMMPVFESLGGEDGPLKQFETLLNELIAKLQPKQGLKRTGQVLGWHFKKDDVRDSIAALERYKTLFGLALQNDQLNLTQMIAENTAKLTEDTSEVKIGVLDLQKSIEEDQRREIIKWFSSIDVAMNHEAACVKHEPSTGDWFIQSTDFNDWKDNPGQFIWLHGFAGSGKTVLCSTIIQETKLFVEHDPERALAYFYFDFRDREKQNVPEFLRSIISQLSDTLKTVPEELKTLYFSKGTQKPTSDIRALMKILNLTFGSQQHVYLIVDALDECTDRECLLQVLSEIAGMKSKKLHILATSRQERDIVERLEAIVARSISIGGSNVDKDIATHVHSQVAEHPKLKRWPDTVKRVIKEKLAEKAQGMFRWVFCQLNVLKTCRKESTLREKLEQLPKDLDETYDRILQGIAEEDAKEAFAAMQWLAYSERPLYLDELAEAVILGPDECSLNNRDRLLDPYDVLHICSSLVVLSSSDLQGVDGLWDEAEMAELEENQNEENGESESGETKYEKADERKTVSLAHFSVKEYLVSDRIRNGPASRFSVSSSAANAFIGQTCLSYLLNFDKEHSLPEKPLQHFPLINYSATHWPYHVRIVEDNPSYSEKTIMLTLKLLDSKSYVLRNWLRVYNPESRYTSRDYKAASPLYYASLLDLPMIAKALIELGADVNEKGGYFNSALAVAPKFILHGDRRLRVPDTPRRGIRNADNTGYLSPNEDRMTAVARLLLDNGADIEAKAEWGASVLHGPAFEGDVVLTRLLLDRGADITVMSDWGGTALYGAAVNGNLDVLQLLVERGADIEARAAYQRTALCAAAGSRNKATVQFILEMGPNLEARDIKGETPLHLAVTSGDEEVVQILLEKGADITAKSDTGQTALHLAALGGHLEVVQLLLQKGADITTEDDRGQTVLHCAVQGLGSRRESKSRKQVVQFLLQNGSDVRARDNNGLTPLDVARHSQNEYLVQQLLAWDDPDLDSK